LNCTPLISERVGRVKVDKEKENTSQRITFPCKKQTVDVNRNIFLKNNIDYNNNNNNNNNNKSLTNIIYFFTKRKIMPWPSAKEFVVPEAVISSAGLNENQLHVNFGHSLDEKD